MVILIQTVGSKKNTLINGETVFSPTRVGYFKLIRVGNCSLPISDDESLGTAGLIIVNQKRERRKVSSIEIRRNELRSIFMQIKLKYMISYSHQSVYVPDIKSIA